jgi:hypothetical protein
MNESREIRTPSRTPWRLLPPIVACALILLTVAFWSCKDSITEPPDIVFPDSNISYNGLIQPLFNQTCALSGGCHAGEDPAAQLSLESYQRLTEKVGIVVPGDPLSSILYLRITETNPNLRMPLYRPALTENQIKGIAQWIREGAINN